jgi:hypothetical protein
LTSAEKNSGPNSTRRALLIQRATEVRSRLLMLNETALLRLEISHLEPRFSMILASAPDGISPAAALRIAATVATASRLRASR